MDEPIQPIRHARVENGRTKNEATAAKRRSPFLESRVSLIALKRSTSFVRDHHRT